MLPSIGLSIGNPTKVGDALTTTGTARVRPFSIIAPPGQHKVTCQQTGATVLSGNIEQSSDGQTTWQTLVAFVLGTTPVQAFDAVPSISYRFNVTSITTTPADIFATLN